MRSSARCALSSDLRCLRLDPGDMLRRMAGPLPALLDVCFILAMGERAAMGTNCAAAQSKEDEEGDAAIWGRSMEARSVTATVRPRVAYKAGLARRCGPAVPLGAEAEEAVQPGRFLPLGPIWPN